MGRNVKTIRAFIFEDDDPLRDSLTNLLRDRGYEVLDFSDPGLCPLYNVTRCRCSDKETCGDVAISDMNMPTISGLEFIERQRKLGCKLGNIALMSGAWRDSDLTYAEQLGCKTFHKPFTFDQINEWLDECETRIKSDRVLADWFKENPFAEADVMDTD